MTELDEVTISVVELEALRLADHESLYQNEAAEKMQISRQTFGRILESARSKIANALVEGKAIKIDGGNFELVETNLLCPKCKRKIIADTQNQHCPRCGNEINLIHKDSKKNLSRIRKKNFKCKFDMQ